MFSRIKKGDEKMKVTLKGLRANKNYSQAEVAIKIGVDKATIINWEKGRTSPNATMLMKLCEVYECKIDDVILPCEPAESR